MCLSFKLSPTVFKMLYAFIGAIGLAFGLSACDENIEVEIRNHDAEFSQTIGNIYEVTTVVAGDELRLKVYGFEQAKELSQEAGWNGVLIAEVMVPEISTRKRLFPPLPEMYRVDVWYDVYGNDANRIERSVERDMKSAGAPMIRIAPPGVYGSSGTVSAIYHESGFLAVDAVLAHVVQELGVEKLVLYGQSSAGNIVAGLTTLRTDILCAVMSSAPLDLVGNNLFNPKLRHNLGARPRYDPLAHVDLVKPSSQRTIWLGYNKRDAIVGSASTLRFASELKERGHVVFVEEAPALDSTHHDLQIWAWKTAFACYTRDVDL